MNFIHSIFAFILLISLLDGSPPSGQRIFLPVVTQDGTRPVLTLDYIPPYGSYENLRGHVTGISPAAYKIAVYIKVSGWWTKPYFVTPLTVIQNDGTWVADITTGGADVLATHLAVFLVPNGYTPPTMSGGVTLPSELYQNAIVYKLVPRPTPQAISFSGHQWEVKSASAPVGPGPNYFSNSPQDVWVDGSGYLHLNIVNRDGKWYSTEVVCIDPLEYGTYTLILGSRIDLLDKNVVLGFFTWDGDASQNNYREIDIEFSRWGDANAANAQYVIQPWSISGNRYRYNLNLSGPLSAHRIDWRPDRIQFGSWDGSGGLLQSWTYSNAQYIPPTAPGAGNARINLWLMNGDAPSNAQSVEVIIKSFEFTPFINSSPSATPAPPSDATPHSHPGKTTPQVRALQCDSHCAGTDAAHPGCP